MSSSHYYKLLIERACVFLREAERLTRESAYDVAVFSAEQSVQLRLKALLYRLWGLVPRTHGLRELLGVLVQHLEDAGLQDLSRMVSESVKALRTSIVLLEEAYTQARYGSIAYSLDDAREAVDAAKKLWRLLEYVEERVAGNVGEVCS